MINRSLLLTLFLLLSFSCGKTPDLSLDPNIDWFGFGSYACYCSGNCARLYRIQEGQLYQRQYNTCEMYELGNPGTVLPADKIALAQPLLDSFPQGLRGSSDETYGCPDCGDWGGYRIFLQKNGQLRSWNIDRIPSLPSWLQPYMTQVDAVITVLGQ